jgi:hypothetical protein
MLMAPFLGLFGYVPASYDALLFNEPLHFLTLGRMAAYALAGCLGTILIWYANRFEGAGEDVKGVTHWAYWLFGYFAASLLVGFLTENFPSAESASLTVSTVMVFVGYPVLLTLALVAPATLTTGLIFAPRAVLFLTGRWTAEGVLLTSGVLRGGQREMIYRVLFAEGPPDYVVADADRFATETQISELMLEAERLRAEIDVLMADEALRAL